MFMPLEKITQFQLENLQNVFESFDDDHDGLIEPENLESILRCLGFNPTSDEIEDMILDLENKQIDFNSFAYIVSRHSRCNNPEADLIDTFRLFDKKNTGLLSVKTIKKILGNTKKQIPYDKINSLICQFSNENEQIDYREFVHTILTG